MNGTDEIQVIAVSTVENGVISEIISTNVVSTNDTLAETDPSEDSSAVIEISDDGTWETKPASSEDLNNAETEKDGKVKEENESKGGFLSPRDEFIVESVKIKHVSLAHSSQYYVNCPVASVKPMVHETVTNGSVAAETTETKMLRVNDVIPIENGNGVYTTESECQSLIHVGLTNGGSVTIEEIEGVEIVEEEEYHSCQCVVPEEQAVAVDSNMASEEVHAKSVSKPVTVLEEEFAVNPSGDPSGGDVVTDSILQNKEKTKTYWEEMMLAAASGKDSPNRSRQSEGRGAEDGEEAQPVFFDTTGGESTVWALGATCPKIVETVAKRTESREEGPETSVRESVIEKDIRVQKEREETLQRERQEAQRMVSPEPDRPSLEDRRDASTPVQRLETPAEVKIALELREMREREEELRRLRQQLGLTKEAVNEASEAGEAFHSIPTTDEGNFSECGGEEKDLGMEVIGSQILSSDMPSLDMSSEHNSFMHRRTQSTDSTSSGHSSGSGGPRAGSDYPPRRRIIVKPLTDPDDEGSHSQFLRRSLHKEDDDMIQLSHQTSNSVKNMKETPIEREIRVAREREEELRREKGLIQRPNQTALTKPEVPPRGGASSVTPPKSQQNVQLRIATNRIQREIQETTEREKELRDAGKIHTISVDTVDSKVTRIGEISESDGAVLENSKRMQKSISTSQISVPEPSPTEVDIEITSHSPSVKSSFTLGRSMSTNTGLGIVGSTNSVGTPSPRRFTPIAGQKGIMERFLASRGKLTCISTFSSSSSSSGSGPTTPMTNNFPTKVASPSPVKFVSPTPAKVVTPAPTVVHRPIAVVPVDNHQVTNDIEPAENTSVPHRRGWMSAEEKIQEELKQMKMREDELRLQRAHIMAQSQPNLLSIMDESDERSQLNDDDEDKMPSLYSTLSNPNLLDLDGDIPVKEADFSQDPAAQKNARRKSALIAQWESRIQQHTDQ